MLYVAISEATQPAHSASFIKSSCVDGPFDARGKIGDAAFGRVRSCVRPVDAAPMAAGPDEVRRSDPNQFVAHGALETLRACPIPGSTGSSSLLTTLAFLRLAY
jgi:hypothetical protein